MHLGRLCYTMVCLLLILAKIITINSVKPYVSCTGFSGMHLTPSQGRMKTVPMFPTPVQTCQWPYGLNVHSMLSTWEHNTTWQQQKDDQDYGADLKPT